MTAPWLSSSAQGLRWLQGSQFLTCNHMPVQRAGGPAWACGHVLLLPDAPQPAKHGPCYALHLPFSSPAPDACSLDLTPPLSHAPVLQMTPHSLIVCIAPTDRLPTPGRSPLGAISRQSPSTSTSTSQGSHHPPAMGKENRPLGWHAKDTKPRTHAAAPACKPGGLSGSQPGASEGRRSGAAAAGLLVGTLVSCCRGAGPTEFELQVQCREVRVGSGPALAGAGAVSAA